MIKIVLDTNILVSSILSEHGSSHKIVEMAIAQIIKNHTSPDILKEFQKVLREDFKQPEEYVRRQIKLVTSYSDIVHPKERINAVKEDPNDDMILECGMACGADYIITGDNHLLKLADFKGIKIIKPADFYLLFSR